MPLTASRINNLNDSFQGNSHKRKYNPCKQRKLKSYESVSLTLNAHAGKRGKSFDLPPRTVGDDGHYYECVVCDNDGELLCCDTCPCTYHLQCVNPPLKSVPPGIWQCENCCQAADLLAPLSSLKGLNKKASSDKNPPLGLLQSLHHLAEAGDLMEKTSEEYVHIDVEQNAANHIGHEKRSNTSSAVNETKVYRRRVQKKALEKEEENDSKNSTRANGLSESENKDQKDRLTTDTSGFFSCSIIQSKFTEPADKVLENDDLNASRPQQQKESNPKPEAQASETVHQAMTTSNCNQSPNMNQYNKLWLLRDVMQDSMKSQHSIQNDEKRELHQALPLKDTESAKAKREKYARLRTRQKQKIALRNRRRGLVPGSRIVKRESPLQMDAEATESVRVHTLESESKERIMQEPLSMKEESTSIFKLLYKSADHIYGRLNSSQNLSIIRNSRRFQHRESRFAGKLPVFSSHRTSDAGCSTMFSANSQEIGDSAVSMQMLNPSGVHRGKNHPWISLGSNLTSTSQLSKNVDSRYGQGNWKAMLTDSSLSFTKHKTVEDLSKRWKMERLRILSPGNLATQGSANSLLIDQRLNCLQVADATLPSLKDQLPPNQGNHVPQNLLLGGLINIPKVKIDLAASENTSQNHRSEAKDLSSKGTVSD